LKEKIAAGKGHETKIGKGPVASYSQDALHCSGRDAMHCVHFCEAEEWRMDWDVRYIRMKIV